MGRIKAIIAFTVLVDVIGFGIVIPSLPFHVAEISGSPLTVTFLFSIFSVCSFFSNPVLGVLSDRYGRRLVLLLSIFSTALGWFIFAGANVLWLLFLGRIIDGLAAGNFSTAHSCLADIAKNDKERTQNFGLIGAVFGIGFIIGPSVGGLLGSISPAFPFWFAGILATFNFFSVLFFLPETNHNKNTSRALEINPIKPLWRAIKNVNMRPSFAVWLLFGLATSATQSITALYFNDVFKFTAASVGLLMSVQGLIMAINQGVGLKNFWLKNFKEPDLELYLLFLFGFGYLLMGFSAPFFFTGIFFTMITMSVLRVVINSQAVGAVGAQMKGEIIGVMNSIASLGMVFGPLLAGPLYKINTGAPYLVSAFYIFLAFIIIYCNRRRLAKLCADTSAVPDTLV